MPRKTKQQVAAEIVALKTIKPKVRRFSFFGDDNHHTIDMQIKALEENLTEDDIINWQSADYRAAYEAIQWREGEEGDNEHLTDDWETLVQS